jgi:hypothetical protein
MPKFEVQGGGFAPSEEKAYHFANFGKEKLKIYITLSRL